MKKVLVVCGTGIATSTMIASKLRSAFEEHCVSAEVIQTNVGSWKNLLNGVAVVVSSVELPKLNVPVLSGVSLLTGIGESETIRRVIELVEATNKEE